MKSGRKNRDFSEPTKRLLGECVAYMCSNPLCRRLTIKAHITEKKSTRLGEAGHIYGASNKGPRYDQEKSDVFIKHYDNGIWLCNVCHKLVDTEKSIYDSLTLKKWKSDTENYVETLVTQDTRLRQLRLLTQNQLSVLRILSGLSTGLDQTFNNPNGNGINMTRLFMELELILFDHQFLDEAIQVNSIMNDLDKIVCPFVHNNRIGNPVNISEWKNKAVKILMINVMRFTNDSYQRYFSQEMAMVNTKLNKLKENGIVPETLELTRTEIGKIK